MDSLSTTSHEIATTLSPAELSELQADREKMGGSKFPQIPQIRLSNKDMKQAPEGEYFIELYKGKDEEPEVRQLGSNPEITILYKTNTYSYYTKEHGLIAWTSDIHGFSAMDNVTLFVKKDGKATISYEGAYPSFKQYMIRNFTQVDPITGDSKKLLKFKTVLYVLFEGKPHKLFVSNASSAGVLDGLPSFDQPQAGSLQSYLDYCWRSKMTIYESTVTLGSRYIDSSKPYYIMTFEKGNPLNDAALSLALTAKKQTEQAILMIDDARRAGEPAPADEPIVNYVNETSAEETPW